jgi:hypothetical protein
MEHIHCRIEYIAEGKPTCNILINQEKQFTFTGDSNFYEFTFKVNPGDFIFTIEHFGKNMKKQANRFIEIKKIFLNDIDIKGMIWETVQMPELPSWQNYNDFNWQGNLYLGHNATISYKFHSPIIDFLFGYHQPTTKVSQGMSSENSSFMLEMKNYFLDIVEKNNS